MNLKEEIGWVFSTTLSEENCQEFVSRLPDILHEARTARDKSKDMYKAKEIFYKVMRAGVVRNYKEGLQTGNPETDVPAIDPKAPEYLIDAACEEELIADRLKLFDWQSLYEQQENVVESLQEKLWSSKKMLEKRQDS